MLHKAAICLVFPLIAVIGCEKTTVEGPNNKKLTLVKPSDASVRRGETEKVAVVVTRSNFSDPVTVSFENLPKGVTVVDDTRRIDGNERTFTLTAAENADLVDNHVASVSATGPGGMTVTEQFRITVREKKS